MIRRVLGSLYGDVPARFPSDFPLSESVARLRERTRRSIFVTMWLTFALLWTCVAALAVLPDGAMKLFFPLYGLGSFAAGIAFLRFCWWRSRNDITFLTSVIQRALSREVT